MNSRTRLLATGALSLVAVAALGVAALWYFVLDTDAAPAVNIDDAIASANTPPAGSSQPSDSPAGDGDLTGDWSLVGDGTSFAGYRIGQQVAGIGSETVVGRTDAVDASFTFDGASIAGFHATVDMTALQSGESLRDNVMRGEGLETDTFPTASFVLTDPLPVDAVPAEGERIARTVSGDLTLHGETRPVDIQVEAALQGGRIIVVGSTEVQLADFGMTPPSGPASVLSVEDHGIMEVQLVFQQATQAPADETPPAQESPSAEGTGSLDDLY